MKTRLDQLVQLGISQSTGMIPKENWNSQKKTQLNQLNWIKKTKPAQTQKVSESVVVFLVLYHDILPIGNHIPMLQFVGLNEIFHKQEFIK